ncbi:MAG: hypothetical protein GX946_07435 [Oligosphaeraceae bacterium]|nr:hypothetical protein [Oligosphaeraceae bacterium]
MKIERTDIQSVGFAERNMFHPKAGRAPNGDLMMALQTIGGSDYYGPVEYSRSADEGILEKGWESGCCKSRS